MAHRRSGMDAYGWEGQHKVGDHHRAAHDGHDRTVHCGRVRMRPGKKTIVCCAPDRRRARSGKLLPGREHELDLTRLWRRIPVKVHQWQERTNKIRGPDKPPHGHFPSGKAPIAGPWRKSHASIPREPIGNRPAGTGPEPLARCCGGRDYSGRHGWSPPTFDTQGLPSHSWRSLLRTLTPIRDPPPSF